ncbi:MRG-like chromatin modification protein [Hamiltosporidium magnivora]|uniref:MRG-like chromatin modification protein n=1 Tax=Hamiltosporidium magnivora TaxID=148818 RepID=A0A4Q9LGT1_9MICR|nr:MRG-like chromatin modification protein [Hamiltosporidium magnivora]
MKVKQQVETQQKKIYINNYIITKSRDEWIEGRIIKIIEVPKPSEEKPDMNIKKYIIYSLRHNIICEEEIPEHSIHRSSIENYKKFKLFPLRAYVEDIHIPVDLFEILKNDYKLVKDKKMIVLPSKFPISKILKEFSKFIVANKPSISEDEILEVVKGFTWYFDKLINPFILYECEIEQYIQYFEKEKNVNLPSNCYGPEHLLRMIFAIQKFLVKDCMDYETQDVIFEYSVYLCDFLNIFLKKYFQEKNYG